MQSKENCPQRVRGLVLCILIALAVLVSGVATGKHWKPPEPVAVADALKAGDAVVVFSTGAPNPCKGDFATDLSVDRIDRATYRRVAWVPANNHTAKSEFPDHHGFVHVLKLPPGEYAFREQIYASHLVASDKPIAKFVVQAGEVVYLGGLFMFVSCSSIGSAFVAHESAHRDLPVARARNPGLEEAHIVTRPLVVIARK